MLFSRCIVVIFCFITISVFSQISVIDSLRNELKKPNHDTTKLQIIESVIGNSVQGDSTSIFCNKEIEKIIFKNLVDSEVDLKLKKRYLYYLAYWYYDKAAEQLNSPNRKNKAIMYFDQSIFIFKYLGMSEEQWSAVVAKGNAYKKINQYDKAIACFFESLKYNEINNNKFGVAVANSSIAHTYEDQGDYNTAIVYYKKSLIYYDSIKTPSQQDLYETAVILHNIGFNYFSINKYTDANVYLQKALKIERENNFYNNIGYIYDKIGAIYLKKEQFADAINILNEGLLYAKKDRVKATLLNTLGEVFYKSRDYNNAEKYLRESLNSSKKINDNNLLETNYQLLYQTYKQLNKTKQALVSFELYQSLKDINNKEAAINTMLKYQLKYDYEKKELHYKIEQEKKLAKIKLDTERKNASKNRLLIILASITLLLLLGAYFFYRNYKQKQRISVFEKNELNQKLLLSQMNPHFIFNSIDNIQSLIYNNQNKEAIGYLNKFSKLTRQILEHSRETYISLSEEVSMIENYLTIQRLLYNNNFDFNIKLEDNIDTDAILLPPMLTQPFIENAIKHGVKNKIGTGMILVSFLFENNKLTFKVEDNGDGFSTIKKAENHKSLAMEIVSERLFNYAKGETVDIFTQNILDGSGNIKGARLFFDIPYIYDN